MQPLLCPVVPPCLQANQCEALCGSAHAGAMDCARAILAFCARRRVNEYRRQVGSGAPGGWEGSL